MADQPIFVRGVKMEANFTGSAFVNFLVPDRDGIYNCQVYDVVFEPGCRNDWHQHPGGQILLCTDGNGYCQIKGQPALRLGKGDVVQIPPDAVHWHGAALDSVFSHVGISPNTQKGPAIWLSPVTDDQYARAVIGSPE